MKKIKEKMKRSAILCMANLFGFTLLIQGSCVKAADFDNSIFQEDITIESEQVQTYSQRNAPYPEKPGVGGHYFYIKNMLTGQYLDVQGGVAANGTNVQQYKFNGTYSQLWYFHYNSDGTYSILSPLGNDGTFRYALDISNGQNANYANAQIWSIDWSADAQRFSLASTEYQTYAIFTKCSNYQKAVVLNGPTCDQGRNVDQYTFQNHINEYWILESAEGNVKFGVDYALANYDKYVHAYPNLTNFVNNSSDCANFVSQCLAAQGVTYEGDWQIYRKNFDTYQPTTVAQLDATWELCQPRTSPWTSAKQFKKYWTPKVYDYHCKATDIINNPNEVFSKSFTMGDAIQFADGVISPGDAFHTMYVVGYSVKDNTITDLILAGHSNSNSGESLKNICKRYYDAGQNPYIIFYSM